MVSNVSLIRSVTKLKTEFTCMANQCSPLKCFGMPLIRSSRPKKVKKKPQLIISQHFFCTWVFEYLSKRSPDERKTYIFPKNLFKVNQHPNKSIFHIGKVWPQFLVYFWFFFKCSGCCTSRPIHLHHRIFAFVFCTFEHIESETCCFIKDICPLCIKQMRAWSVCVMRLCVWLERW